MEDTERVYRFTANARFFDFDAHSFIIDLDSRSFYNLGTSSALIASRVDGVRNVGQIAAAVRERYPVSEADSLAAIAKFIGMMREKQLIEVSG